MERAENGDFCAINTVLGPIFNGFFLNGKGGYPHPPLHGKFPCRGFLKPSLIGLTILILIIVVVIIRTSTTSSPMSVDVLADAKKVTRH